MYTCVCVYVCVCVHSKQGHWCMGGHSKHLRRRIQLCTHTHPHTHMHGFDYPHAHVCMYVCISIIAQQVNYQNQINVYTYICACAARRRTHIHTSTYMCVRVCDFIYFVRCACFVFCLLQMYKKLKTYLYEQWKCARRKHIYLFI